jgi:hypothetical protein
MLSLQPENVHSAEIKQNFVSAGRESGKTSCRELKWEATKK